MIHPLPCFSKWRMTCNSKGGLTASLYGSFAKGNAEAHSYIDLTLLLPEQHDPWQQLPELDHELIKLANKTVNWVSIIRAPTPLAHDAIQGHRLFDEDQAILIEQRIWSKWEDYQYWNRNGWSKPISPPCSGMCYAIVHDYLNLGGLRLKRY